MRFAGGEAVAAVRLVELGDEISAPGADPPPAPAAEGLGRGRQLDPVVVVGLLARLVVGGGVVQASPSAVLTHVSLVADGGDLSA